MSASTAELFIAHRARVYRWAHAMTRRHADALDALQEVFLRLVRSRPYFANERAAIAWLRCATTSVVIDQWRGRRAADAALRRPGREAAPSPRDPVESAESADTAARIRDAVARLSSQQQLVFLAKVCDDETFQSIADEMGIAIPTAKTHYLRALAALRDALGNADALCDAAPETIIRMPKRGESHDVPRISI